LCKSVEENRPIIKARKDSALLPILEYPKWTEKEHFKHFASDDSNTNMAINTITDYDSTDDTDPSPILNDPINEEEVKRNIKKLHKTKNYPSLPQAVCVCMCGRYIFEEVDLLQNL